MNNAIIKTLFTALVVSFSGLVYAQKLVIDDQDSALNEEIDSLLTAKFASKNITYTNLMDYKQKCDYQFAKIFVNEGQTFASIKDCKDQLLGTKNLGNSFSSAINADKATLLFYALWDLIDNPVIEYEPLASQQVSVKVINKNEPELNDEGVVLDPSVSEHDSRYFFAPSARPLKQGELYYNTIYFLIHDLQYGITDRLSFGMGTTIIGFPFYFTTKYSIPINEKSHFAVGDLLILGTYGADFAGNLLFASYTYGSDKSNITIGEGVFTSNNREVTDKQFTFVSNVNGILSLGKYFYLISENYISPLSQEQEVYRTVYNPDGSYGYFEEGSYSSNNIVWFGVSGIRFVTKKSSLASFQFGLTYYLNIPGKIPSPYQQSEWQNLNGSNTGFLAFPTISFTRKFKLK